jgi:hypothetical protein
MRILFTITVLCLLVLLWAGLAIRRHVLTAAREREGRLERPKVTAAVEVELRQELRKAREEKGFFGSVSDPQTARHGSRNRPSVRESAIRAASEPSPTVVEPAAPTPEPVQAAETPEPEPQATVQAQKPENGESAINEFRKPPVSINGTKFERLDLAHFNKNKDLGDLSDPYQIPRTAVRNRS